MSAGGRRWYRGVAGGWRRAEAARTASDADGHDDRDGRREEALQESAWRRAATWRVAAARRLKKVATTGSSGGGDRDPSKP
jgi:hypothetical protein